MSSTFARAVVVVITALGAVSALSPAPSAPSAVDPWRALIATSRCQAWGKLRAVRFSGTQQSDGLQGREERLFEPSTGRFVDRSYNGQFSVASGYDADVAWSVDRSGGSHRLNAPFAIALARADAWVASRGWCRAARGGASVIRETSRAVGGTSYGIVSLRAPGGAVVELWTDAGGRLAKAVEQQEEARVETHFEDVRYVSNTPIAFVVTSTDISSGDVSVTRWNTVEPTHSQPAATYEQPPLPDDFSRFAGTTNVPAHFEGPKIFVDATINGKGPFPLILDTGGHLILVPEAARTLGLIAKGSGIGTGGGAGTVRVGFARIHALRLGRAVLHDQSVKILPLHYGRDYRGPRPPVAGVIGLELFERYAVRIDPQKRTVRVWSFETAERPLGATLPLTFAEDAPLIDGAVDGHRGPLEVDSGNGGFVILEPVFAKRAGIAGRFHTGHASTSTGVGGTYSTALGRIALDFGPETLHDEATELPRTPEGAEATVVTAANVGTSVLSRFISTFDYESLTMTVQAIARAPQVPAVETGLTLKRLADGTYRISRIASQSAAARTALRVGMVIEAVNGVESPSLGLVDIQEMAEHRVGRNLELLTKSAGRLKSVPVAIRDVIPRN